MGLLPDAEPCGDGALSHGRASRGPGSGAPAITTAGEFLREEWRGHLWRERFHLFPMDEPYLLATVRYVERKPVAAPLCRRPEAWPWSSAAHLRGRDDGRTFGRCRSGWTIGQRTYPMPKTRKSPYISASVPAPAGRWATTGSFERWSPFPAASCADAGPGHKGGRKRNKYTVPESPGAFGYEAEHYDVSMKMAELNLLPAVWEADSETIIVADGTSCRHQIEDGANRQAVHVARVLGMGVKTH